MALINKKIIGNTTLYDFLVPEYVVCEEHKEHAISGLQMIDSCGGVLYKALEVKGNIKGLGRLEVRNSRENYNTDMYKTYYIYCTHGCNGK